MIIFSNYSIFKATSIEKTDLFKIDNPDRDLRIWPSLAWLAGYNRDGFIKIGFEAWVFIKGIFSS
jgi:hypothetical protein